MSDLNDRVIEAAAEAIQDVSLVSYSPFVEHLAEVAILAADKVRTPVIIAAVDQLIQATQAWNIYTVAENPDVIAARRDLLALFGIEESS